MVRNKGIILMIVLLFCMSCQSQRLRNIKHFKKEILEKIHTDGYYECIGMYDSDKFYNVERKINSGYEFSLKFHTSGYVDKNDNSISNKEGYSGVIYEKRGNLKIDLIELTHGRSKIVTTYKVKIEGNRLHILEDSFFRRTDLSYSIYEWRSGD